MKILRCLCIGLVLCSVLNAKAQQISTDDSQTLEALIQANLGLGCVDISNVSSSINGQPDGISSFGAFNKAGSDFPFESGIILSTGDIHAAGNGLNTNNLNDGTSNWTTDPDLEQVLGISGTLNATSIEFDFLATTSQISFDYIMASEEYNSNFPCQYSDGFAFLIKQANSSEPYTNIALVPGTTIPVATNTIHDEIVGFCPPENEEFFEGYNIGDTNYNGRTTVLTAAIDIHPNVVYKVKLIIADQTDNNYDSAVFIQSTSTLSSVDLGPDVSACAQSIILNGDVQNDQASYQWYKDGIPIAGATNSTFQAVESGTYAIEVNIQINNTICTVEDEVVINLGSEQDVGDVTDFVVCDDLPNDGVEIFDLTLKNAEILAALPAGNYDISYHLTNVGSITETATITVPWQNTSNPQTIFVRTEEISTGCLGFTTFDLIVNGAPEYPEPSDINICDDGVADGMTQISFDDTTAMITENNPNLIVSYYNNQTQAELGGSPVGQPYGNTNPNETLYIRVEDSFTGCFDIRPINITVLENPVINSEVQWITACETDNDGFEIFDITSVTSDILQGLTGVSVAFFESESNAEEDINPIDNPSNYQNTTPFFQLVYIKVTNNSTGCYSIMPIELHTNIVDSGFDTSNYGVCDDETNDGIAEVDLSDLELTILNNYQGFEILFYETEDDQLNNVNALDETVPFVVSSTVTTIYLSSTLDDCTQYASVSIVIHPAFQIQDLEMVEYCDTDFDGSTDIVLSTFNDYVSTGINSPSTRYYLNEQDALNDENALPQVYVNPVNPVTVYARVTNTQTSCWDVSPLEILVIDPPVVTQPSDIIICDDDQDGFFIVDLESRIPEIVPNTTDLVITFHQSFSDADDGSNAVTSPDAYNTQTKTIFTRVESLITTCHSIVEFEVIVNTLPVFDPISTFITCESDGDEINDFFFNEKDEEILNGQTGKEVLYFETQIDALTRTNSIDKNVAYQNLSNPQTIYIRVENISDMECYGTSSMQIEVLQFITFNEPTDISVCDDASNDGTESLNLNSKINEIASGNPVNLDITFHESYDDAEAGINELPLNYANVTNPQQIYVRVGNVDFCSVVTDFTVNIIQVPEINPAPDLNDCDDDYDGIITFDLTQVELDVLDVRADDIEITYHETVADVENSTAEIQNPENYTNISNPQVVYIKVTNTVSNCYNYEPINLSVTLPPEINDFEQYGICVNPTSSFDLTEIESVIVNDTTDIAFTYYSTLDDAQNDANSLDTNYTYTTINDIIFVRVTSLTTGCFYIYSFELIVNPLPIANQPPDLEVCDDDSNDSIEAFNLFLVNDAVLGSQSSNDFTVTYYPSDTEAALGENPLTYNYSGQDGETIHARIENNTTGCFSLTQFNLIVNDHPSVPANLVNCDIDYDGITSFDLTLSVADLFETSNPDNSFSYFESLDDLQNDVNEIADATNYTNQTNPQTVYIKVLNNVANCYTYVPLELNVNLPPAINPIDSFELCETDSGIVQLTEINSTLLLQTANVIVEYYPSESDALNETNVLDADYAYNSTNDTIFARIKFSTTQCYHIHEFELFINPLPVANAPDHLVACDDDFDGQLNFDLSVQNDQVLNGQDPNEFSVAYFNDLIDAEDNENPIAINYNAIDNETIFVRVENISTGCYDITSFQIFINRKPIVDIGPQVICLNELPLLVSANTNQPGDTYLWSTNEITPEIEITEIGTYSVTVTSSLGCESTEVFEVTESESALITVTESIDFSDPNNVVVTVEGIGDYLYQLEDNDFSNSFNDYGPQTSNVFQNVALGYYTLTVTDLNGCDSITKRIVVIDAPKFMTPNDDGHFDTWHITGIETLPGTIIYIFDRYGKLLKTLTSNSSGWNGYYNGSLMPVSDYWYVAKVIKDGKSFEVKGHFSLRY